PGDDAVKALACVALAACATGPGARVPAPSPPRVAWTLPGIDPDPAFIPPPIVEHQLANGIRILVVEMHRLPLVSIATIHGGAGGRADGPRHGLAALTADALDEDPALAPALERAGARLDVDIATDYASVHATALATSAEATLDMIADVVRRPLLLARDVDRLRRARVAELALRDDRPRTVAALAFDRLVFGDHPYGSPPEGDRASVATLGVEDVRSFHHATYNPATTTIIVVGDLAPAAAIQAIDRAFGDWTVHDPETSPPPLAPPTAPVLAVIDRPGAPECAFVIGKRATGAAGDRMAAEVASTILGGASGSRLDRRLRTELHLTSGIAASYWRGELGASWSIAFATSTGEAARALREVLAQLAALRATDPTAAELADAKHLLARAIPTAFETTAATARALERLVVQRRPLASYASFRERIDAVTATAARSATRSWSDPSIVVVGDWAVIGKQLEQDLATLGLPVVRISP
ncbi:MAG: pitrilysin family protein, partial [Proteobacteria bacterium]|nr:pitrilysin family protein [Pseudomonadota bacterium]